MQSKITTTLKSILDGIGSYFIWYLWTSFLLFGGFWLVGIIEVSYLQCFGGLILFRQLITMVKKAGEQHIKKEDHSEKAVSTTEKDRPISFRELYLNQREKNQFLIKKLGYVYGKSYILAHNDDWDQIKPDALKLWNEVKEFESYYKNQ